MAGLKFNEVELMKKGTDWLRARPTAYFAGFPVDRNAVAAHRLVAVFFARGLRIGRQHVAQTLKGRTGKRGPPGGP